MKKLNKLFVLFALAPALLCACNKDEGKSGEPGQSGVTPTEVQPSTSGSSQKTEHSVQIATQGDSWNLKFSAGVNFSFADPRDKLIDYFNEQAGVNDLVEFFDANNVFSQSRNDDNDRVLSVNSNKAYADWIMTFNYDIVSIEIQAQVYYKLYTGGSTIDTDVTFTVAGEEFSLDNSETTPTPTKVCRHTFATPTKEFHIEGAQHNGGRAYFNYVKLTYLA